MNKKEIVVALKKLLEESAEYETARLGEQYLEDGIKEIVEKIEKDSNNPLLVKEFTLSYKVDELEVMNKLNPIERRMIIINKEINNAIKKLNEMKIKIGVEVRE